MTIYRGDAYLIPVLVTIGNALVNPTNCKEVEISIGMLIKSSKGGDVRYNNGKWYFPLFQEESFEFPLFEVPVQVRVHLSNGEVRGTDCEPIEVMKNLSKVVMTDD